MKTIFFLISVFIISSQISLQAQQVADNDYNPEIYKPEYNFGKGPLVHIDMGHNNFHTRAGRYSPFAWLMGRDGYRVKDYKGDFSDKGLKDIGILVIANALNEANITSWYKPVLSAFSEKEILTLKRWVEKGGSLFLIADHMPMGGAARDLAAAFGFGFTDGFAMDTAQTGPDFFTLEDNTLIECSISEGRNRHEKVDKIVTFTGQGFTIPPEAISILEFDNKFLLLESDTAWVFGPETKFSPLEGWSQGACMEYGKGRVVMFGEAAMFTAQLSGNQKAKVGMNSDYAEQNYQLLLNIIHWLDRRF